MSIGNFLGRLESSNLSREILSREIGRVMLAKEDFSLLPNLFKPPPDLGSKCSIPKLPNCCVDSAESSTTNLTA